MRMIAMPDVGEQREHDRQQDALLDTEHHDDHRRQRAPRRARRRATGRSSACPRCRRVRRRSGRRSRPAPRRHVGERFRQEQRHDQDDDPGRELRDLAAPTGAIDHLGLRGAAVHHEGSRETGRRVARTRARRGRRSRRRIPGTCAAYAREVAALWARTTRKIDAAVGISVSHSLQPGEGMPKEGRPLGTVPSVATPCADRSAHWLTAIAPITAMSAPGTSSRPP